MVGLNTSRINFGNAQATPTEAPAIAATPVATVPQEVADKLAPTTADIFMKPQAFQQEEAAPAAQSIAPEKTEKTGHPILKTIVTAAVLTAGYLGLKRFGPEFAKNGIAKLEEGVKSLLSRFKKDGSDAGEKIKTQATAAAEEVSTPI